MFTVCNIEYTRSMSLEFEIPTLFYYGGNKGLDMPPPTKCYIASYLSNQKLLQADFFQYVILRGIGG